jgi:hypothetical protein
MDSFNYSLPVYNSKENLTSSLQYCVTLLPECRDLSIVIFDVKLYGVEPFRIGRCESDGAKQFK